MSKAKQTLLVLAVSYALIEMLLWIFRIPRQYGLHSFPAQFELSSNSGIVYVNRPDSSIDFVYPENPRGYFEPGNVVRHRTNAYGFRGKNFSLEKPAGKKRIVFLGDSFVFGEGVHDTDTVVQKLEKKLLEKNIRAEVINLGVGGYNTRQEWVLLRDFAYQLDPDIVIVGYTPNDAEPDLFFQSETGLKRRNREMFVPELSPTPPFAARVSRVIRLGWQIIDTRRRNEEIRQYYLSLYGNSAYGWMQTKEAISRMGIFLKEKKIPGFFVLFPLLYRLDQYPFGRITRLVENEVASAGMDAINLLPFLKEKKESDVWVYPTDQHPNEVVHEKAAEALVSFVEKHLKP